MRWEDAAVRLTVPGAGVRTPLAEAFDLGSVA
jgi:hypothetical protein